MINCHLLRFALFLICLVPSISSANTQQSTVNALIQQANDIKLSQHPVWLKLLHYEQHYFNTRQFISAIHDDDFFNSALGKNNPSKELEATLQAFNKPVPASDSNSHAQCRFPARFIWLKKSLKIEPSPFPTVDCQRFSAWTLNHSINSLSLVYASGFLDNPASYYGHILLKLNTSKADRQTNLIDPSINYGAIIPADENPVSYIAKGIFGGYDGGFTQTDYYFHNQNYGELELRDLWEYELNLTHAQVQFVVAHAWELLGKRYTYYFFKRNCAYRLAELIEIIDDTKINPNNPFFTLPRALLQNLDNNGNDEVSLLRSVKYRPSRQARFYQKYNALETTEKNVIGDFSTHFEPIAHQQYAALSPTSKANVLNALIDYYQYANAAQILSKDDATDQHHKAIIERFKLPPAKSSLLIPVVEPPHNGRKSSRASIGITHNENYGTGLSLALRPAYYDGLDASAGQLKNSTLSMAEIKLFIKQDSVHINQLDLVKIESANNHQNSLLGDTGTAWKIKLGLRQKNLNCLDCLTSRLEGDYGFSTNLGTKISIAAYGGAGIQDNQQGSGNLFIRAALLSHFHITDTFNMRLAIERPKQIDGSGGLNNNYLFEARQRLALNTDIRFLYEKNDAQQFSINLGFYF